MKFQNNSKFFQRHWIVNHFLINLMDQIEFSEEEEDRANGLSPRKMNEYVKKIRRAKVWEFTQKVLAVWMQDEESPEEIAIKRDGQEYCYYFSPVLQKYVWGTGKASSVDFYPRPDECLRMIKSFTKSRWDRHAKAIYERKYIWKQRRQEYN